MIDDRGLTYLTKNVWSHLCTLNLKDNLISSRGIAALAKLHFKASKRSLFNFSNIFQYVAGNKKINDECCPYLLKS